MATILTPLYRPREEMKQIKVDMTLNGWYFYTTTTYSCSVMLYGNDTLRDEEDHLMVYKAEKKTCKRQQYSTIYISESI